MGTRHLIGVVLDGDFKVAQYGQWDGYPSGQGSDVLAFLKSPDLKINEFIEHTRRLRWATDEDFAKRAAATGIPEDQGWVTMEESNRLNAYYPWLDRSVGAEILPAIASGRVEWLRDSRDFGEDSLFCEWAYVIDLDERTLECYRGFQHEVPDSGRWAGKRGLDHKGDPSDYAAVHLIQTWALDELPDEKDFCEALDPLDDEDD